jgi:protein-tyrosine phosphatase
MGLYIHQRFIAANFHTVVAGDLYRSAAPSAGQLETWIAEYELRTVLNLRDDRAFDRESTRVRRAGLNYLHLPFSDRVLPERQEFLALVDTLAQLEGPLLIHCRAGADRTGVVAAIAAMSRHDWDVERAVRQLGPRFLHFHSSENAVEGVLLRYREYCRQQHRSCGGYAEFRAWLEQHYSHGPYLIAIEAPARIEAPASTLHPVSLRIHNRTDFTIPASSARRQFRVAAYAGSAVDLVPDREYPPRLELTQSIPPHGVAELEMPIWTPDVPGNYEIRFDLIEENVTWFAAQGSPEPARQLIVTAR